jgi:hypothetical protein
MLAMRAVRIALDDGFLDGSVRAFRRYWAVMMTFCGRMRNAMLVATTVKPMRDESGGAVAAM